MTKTSKRISYGPHSFPGGPERYIRNGNLELSIDEAHGNIIQTLVNAFGYDSSSIPSQLDEEFGLGNQDVSLDFINYGNTELVYLATFEKGMKLTTLINQPQVQLGNVKKEFDNLKQVFEIDPRFVVEPFAHFSMQRTGHELYVSQYVDKAICVAVNEVQGIYDPRPEYHFERFSPEMASEANSSMIALLVNYYDREGNRGLARTHVSGNDFILTRDFDKRDPHTMQSNIKLIAAREFIEAPLKKYLDRLRQEFVIGTTREDARVLDRSMKINTSSKIPMTEQEIEKGIKRGLRLRQQHDVI